ncbi:MAG TPA: NUDIX hydrolase [Pseudonocardiaceae bacterium]|jgi:8-oxo-dGTP pyrophosphatase MutT (NUDIX family)/phosphohistidine phosphatase SixA
MTLPGLIAAGAVVWQPSLAGDVEVALIHRPRYDDWSLPKGKPHAGETLPATAVREVVEETGCTVTLGPRLGCTRYPVSAGQKVAHYWVARPIGGDFRPSNEVDELRWLPVPKALELLSHQHDRTLLTGLEARTAVTSAVLLVRHADAGDRESWQGDDELRPLTVEGHRQAESLRAVLPLFGARRVYSASPLRCRQTVEGLAADLGVPISTEPWLSEEGYASNPAADHTRLLEIAAEPGGPAVVCSQGGVIPDLLRNLPGSTGSELTDVPKKGSYWALFFASSSPTPPILLAADYYDDNALGGA